MDQQYKIPVERLGRIVEESASEAYLFDHQSCNFLLVNKGGRENLGRSMAELRKLAPWDIKPEISRERFLEMVQPLRDGTLARLDFETVHQRKDGSLYDVSVRLQLIDAHDDPVFYAAIQDVTAAKSSARELRETMARMDAILGNTMMAVFMMDHRQHCVFMNRAAEELTGYSFAETEGRPLHDVIHHSYPDGRPFPLHECAIDRALPEEHQTQGEEMFVHKDGHFYPVGFTASPMKDERGQTIGTVIEARDISADIASRKAMEAFNHTLQERIEEALAERRTLEAQLVQAQKMEALGQLTGGIAHDFNNLLQVISGNLQLLEKDLMPGDPRRRRIANALIGVDRGAQLASQLLAFGRQQPLSPKALNLGRLVRGMDDMLRRSLGGAIDIDIIISGGLWNCFADRAQVENALLNLAINARDAMQGRGKLTIEAGNALLDDAYVRDHPGLAAGQYVMLAVTDTGSGIPPEILARVFDPFFTTKRPGQGTGLGLSMVYGFVKQSDGHIRIYSEAGEGTTIRIYLPRSRQAEDAEPAPQGPAPDLNGSETVLLVEDDEAVRATAHELLAGLGYRVLTAVNADEAMTIIDKGAAVDLLFTDVVMPGTLRSPELARLARQKLPGLKVLFTSGYTQNAIVHAGRLDDGVELISKPYSQERLATKIRQILGPSPQSPASVPTEAPPPAAAEPAAAGGAERTALAILVVEDEVLIQMMLADMLTEAGHGTATAGTLAEARRALAAERFDLVITDIGLPDGSGSDLAREVIAAHPHMQVAIASGSDSASALAGELPAGRVHILHKPFNDDALHRMLDAVVAAGGTGTPD